MVSSLIPLSLLLASSPDGSRLEAVGSTFADEETCRAHLDKLVERAREAGALAVEGPHAAAGGVTLVRLAQPEQDGSFKIVELSCSGGEFRSRSWIESAAPDK